MYDLTAIWSSLNPLEWYVALNDLSGGMLTGMLLFIIYIIMFVAASKTDIRKGMIAISFIMMIISIPALIMGFISWGILIAPILMFFGGLIAYYFVN